MFNIQKNEDKKPSWLRKRVKTKYEFLTDKGHLLALITFEGNA